MLISVHYVFFFNDTATTEIYTLSLHDALPISGGGGARAGRQVHRPEATRSASAAQVLCAAPRRRRFGTDRDARSEEHTSELQSRQYLVCRLLLEKKKEKIRDELTILQKLVWTC